MDEKKQFFYVARDAQGSIDGLFLHPHADATEAVARDDSEVMSFLAHHLASDLSMVRTVKEIVELLILKDVIAITDLSDAVLEKLNMERILHDQLHDYTIDDDTEF